MNKSIMKSHPLMKIFYSSIINLPTPINISYLWNFGSILGLFMLIQIISGVILSMHYCPNISMAFNSIIHINENMNNGWLMHFIHMNGASMLFINIQIHIFRGIYYSSYSLSMTWFIGWLMLFLMMMSAFMGYVLPWGQMSYWGATVITNLLSTIPMFGDIMVKWIWGGFSINNATLNRFFSMHFIIPLIISLFIMIHLMTLHNTGSNNPLGMNSNFWKIPFHPYFSLKDTLGFTIILSIFFLFILMFPYNLSDPENFIPANPMTTPIHIQPEWYFLFAYAILRSIPNKMGGVIAMFLSILLLLILSLSPQTFKTLSFYPLTQMSYWIFLNSLFILSWLGAQQIMMPFILLSQIFSFLYFMFFIIFFPMNFFWDKFILS
uniref:cytochrome b n=1 Tax=Sirex nitobei TaxID=1602346 RepID=UPI0023D85B30|nr:cytochrome b [Sirex nitobei]WDR47219.1 cytochrome b [Sirex nitobei]